MIIGKKLILRAMQRSDAGWIADARNHPDVYEHFYEYAPTNIELQDKWISQSGTDFKTSYMFVVCERDAAVDKWLNHGFDLFNNDQILHCVKPLGTVGIYDIDWRSRKCEWGRLFLRGDVRGKGYGQEIEKLIYRFVFEQLGMNKLYCEVFADNTRVVAMHEKFGSRIEGTLRDHVLKNGEHRDVVTMSILKAEYESLKGQDRYALEENDAQAV